MTTNANSVVVWKTKIYYIHHLMMPKLYSNIISNHGNEKKSSSQRVCLLKNKGSSSDFKD